MLVFLVVFVIFFFLCLGCCLCCLIFGGGDIFICSCKLVVRLLCLHVVFCCFLMVPLPPVWVGDFLFIDLFFFLFLLFFFFFSSFFFEWVTPVG